MISTIGDLIDHGFRMHVGCRACCRSVVVDLEALAQRLGRDRVYVGPSLRFRCERCGSRDVASTIEAPSRLSGSGSYDA